MYLLDMRTIVFSYLITNIICVWFVVQLWRQNRNRFAGTVFWVIDFLFQAVALFLIVMRGAIPDWISMILSNTLVISGAILGFVGQERFLGKKGPQIQNYLLVILFISVHSYFALIQPNLAVRNLNIAVALLLVCFQSVWLMWRRVEPGRRSLTFGVGMVNLLYCLVSSVRIVDYFAASNENNNYFHPAFFQALVILSYQVLFILLTYSFVLMVNKRLIMDVGTQEEKFSKAFHSAPYAIMITRPSDGKIIEVNEKVSAISGYGRNEILENSAIALHLWERDEDRAAVVDELSKTGKVDGKEACFRRKNGETMVGLFSAEILPIDGENFILSSIADITERKHIEDALRQSEASLSRAQMIAHLGNWEYDIETGKTTWSDEAYRIFGFSPHEVEVTSDLLLNMTHPEDRDRVLKGMNDLRDGSVQYDVEYRIIRRDGTERYVHSRRYVSVGGEDPGKIFGMIQDITDRRLAEEEKVKLEAQNRQLMKSESLGRMAGAIAHTFNNQLAVVIGSLEMAIDDLPKDEEPVNRLSIAMQAAGKAANMSGMMLTYLGQISGKRDALDLSECCLRDLPKLRAAIPENIILETDFLSPGPIVSADVDQIQKVLSNLVTNAWEAIGNDGGSIHLGVKTVSQTEISTAHRHPIEWQPQNTAYACLEVTDTGVGIAHKDIESLFDPFFSSKFTGRGLGLAVVLGIVRSYSGVITVESKPGRGSKFQVFLPVATNAVIRQPNQMGAPPTTAASGTILLVEDEEMLRNMAAAMLTRLDYSVIEAKDGVEAMELFRQHKDEIRLVLSDLTMPRMNGWETLTALRKLAPDLPVILASGYDKAHVMAGDHPELPQAFLCKPYKPPCPARAQRRMKIGLL
ncbi:MAG: PAS domain S-box protein, partial [Deltaproteobacteria bacterium]